MTPNATLRAHFISPKRVEANRRNAQHSTGPKTEEGKKVTRLNACRHFLTAQVSILPPAEREVVEAFCAPLVANLAPGNDFERQLARAIAEAQWRLNRARAMEETFFAAEIAYAEPEQAAGGH